jgi:hypothetical protein
VSTKKERIVPSGEHPIPERHTEPHHNRLLYAIVGLLCVGLVVVGLAAYQQATDNTLAQQKATQLEQVFKEGGLPVPASLDVITKSLGTDGGAVCKTSGYDLTAAILDQGLTAGGGGVAARPLPIDRSVIDGELAIITVYCPSRAAAFLSYFQNYTFYQLINR